MSTHSFEHTLLHTLANNVPHRIYAKDTQSRFIFANKCVAQEMGLETPEELLGKTDFDFYPHEDAAEFAASEQDMLRTGVPILNREEFVDCQTNQQKRWLLTTKIPLYDDNQKIIGLAGINYDITQQKHSQNELRAAHKQSEDMRVELQETITLLSREIKERQRFENALRQQALHDGLTGLPNRTLLVERLEHAMELSRREKTSLTLLFIDLDRLKMVNDSLGHNEGDELIKEVANRICKNIRKHDTCARFGGDEFVILLPNDITYSALGRITNDIIRAISAPLHLGGVELSVTCSIGCSTYPQDAGDADTLIKHADTAMYQAKKQGGNSVKFYTQSYSIGVTERLTFESELRSAISNNELLLHYQPQLDVASGKIVGVEALVRWLHPERGMVPPLDFIAIAEETGLIEPIGEWVLREACSQAAKWNQIGFSVRMSVNLSACQLMSPDLDDLVSGIIKEVDLPAQQLEVELTESVSMQNPEETIRILKRFRALGIQIAIDDFGTGYSNLAYLRHFPVNRIKIDRSFVNELTQENSSQAIVEAIIMMAHNLDLGIVAEGVETIEQHDQLAAYHCDLIQGYWLSRPLDSAACETFLREHRLLDQ